MCGKETFIAVGEQIAILLFMAIGFVFSQILWLQFQGNVGEEYRFQHIKKTEFCDYLTPQYYICASIVLW